GRSMNPKEPSEILIHKPGTRELISFPRNLYKKKFESALLRLIHTYTCTTSMHKSPGISNSSIEFSAFIWPGAGVPDRDNNCQRRSHSLWRSKTYRGRDSGGNWLRCPHHTNGIGQQNRTLCVSNTGSNRHDRKLAGAATRADNDHVLKTA